MTNLTLPSAIERAIECIGSATSLATILRVSSSAVGQWKSGGRPIPIERCTQIEQATSGAVRRWHLRPDDWHLIWPELLNVEGAPAITTADAAEQGVAHG